jgi:hypothetical protein
LVSGRQAVELVEGDVAVTNRPQRGLHSGDVAAGPHSCGVARTVIAAAEGRLDDLPRVGSPFDPVQTPDIGPARQLQPTRQR